MKTKTHLTLVALLFLTKIMFAQDTIFMRNDSIKIGLVKEITESEVKYKHIDNPQGPNYIIDKYEVGKIKYANGVIDVFEYVNPWLRKNAAEKSITNKTPDSLSIHQNKLKVAMIHPQNNEIKRNKRSMNYYTDTSSNHITMMDKTAFFYKGQIRSKYEIQEIMLKKNDPYINEKIASARSGKSMRYIAFADIPISITGFGVLINALDNGLEGEKLQDKQILSSVLLIAGAACFTIGMYNEGAYKKNTVRAHRRYNQLINE